VTVAAVMTERQLQEAVVALARLHGWLVYHTFDSRRSQGGFPDLVLARSRTGVVFAELKTEKGRVSPAQDLWARTITAAGAKVYLWRPQDWLDGSVEAALA
jgi:hypothetical protein